MISLDTPSLQHDLFERYRELAAAADGAFRRFQSDYSDRVLCQPGCRDCCHAVFGLFLIEAVWIHSHFEDLSRKDRRPALLRCEKSRKEIERLRTRILPFADDPFRSNRLMAQERVRCPMLLPTGLCLIYPWRPITCRIYGIPTVIQGRIRYCPKSGFGPDEAYPAFSLDTVFRELYQLSRSLLAGLEQGDPLKADLLVSLPAVLGQPLERLVKTHFGWS
ncbi:YkgJ family cysteine cluster protein [Desulfatiglans anilini]|uniref:YkgJ family cysteine cluster protein n=1 Tax=Desulfatiglans anilini TaxID=90728 RepID=UPI001294652B|nr:hypothetical protein [Desulfatiglans anilini]